MIGGLVRYVFCLANFVFVVVGIMLMAAGGYSKVQTELPHVFRVSEVDRYQGYANGAIALGVLTFVFSFFGCCGAWHKNRVLLAIYALLICGLLIGEIALISIVSKGEHIDPADIVHQMGREWRGSADGVRNDIQRQFKCCGFMNVTDLPGSVCFGLPGQQTPCVSAIADSIEHIAKVITTVLAIIIAVEIVGFMVSCCVLCYIQGLNERGDSLLGHDNKQGLSAYNTSYAPMAGRKA